MDPWYSSREGIWIGVKGKGGRWITVRGKISLILGVFSPFLGCPALFLRPSTIGVKADEVGGRERE